MGAERTAELVGALGALRGRIVDACRAAGRDPHSVTLVAVTKTYPAEDIATLAQLGVHDIGESKDQEARAKIADLARISGGQPIAALRWHLVGRLQTNKARSVVQYAHAVHSVDRVALVDALATAAQHRRADTLAPLEVFVQVSLDADPDRGGVPVAGVEEVVAAVAAQPTLVLRGLMAVPPIGADPDEAFAALADLSAQVRNAHPRADAISAGMSGDLEAAVRHGATHVRIGTALLGRRAPVFG
jgi:pyridoxal phosphate enzyme (YggS family)